MENENEKKSLWKRFKDLVKKILPGKKTAVALGIAASTLAADVDKAHASGYIVERTDDKTITDVANKLNVNPVVLTDLTVDASQLKNRIDTRSDLEKASDTLKSIESGVNNIENVFGSISNLGNSSSISSTVNNVKRVADNVSKTEDSLSQLLSKPSVKEVKTEEIKTENVKNEVSKQVESEKSDNVVVENAETKSATINEAFSQSNLDKEIEQVLKNSHFNSIQYNPYDLEDALSKEIVDLSVQVSKAKYDGDFDLANKLQERLDTKRAQRIELTNLAREEGQKAETLENAPEYSQREFTPERIQRATAFINLSPNWTTGEKIAVLSDGIVNLKTAIDGCIKNGDMETANKLIRVHDDALKQRYELSKFAHEDQGNPEYDLHMPENYKRYNVKNSSTKIQENKKVEEKEKKHKYSPSKIEGINVEDILGNIDLASAAMTGTLSTSEKQQDLDYSKLSNVSVGQMGVLEEDEMPQEIAHKEEDEYSKLANVSSGQMGIWNEIEDIIDNKTNSTTPNSDKKEVVIEEKEEKEEVKETKSSKNIDNDKAYKDNTGKIDVNDIFKGIDISEFIEKGKSRDDDGEER